MIKHCSKPTKHGRHRRYPALAFFRLEDHHSMLILTSKAKDGDALISYEDAESMFGKKFVDRGFGYADDEYLDVIKTEEERDD